MIKYHDLFQLRISMAIYTIVLKNSSDMGSLKREMGKNILGYEIYEYSNTVCLISIKDEHYINDLAKKIGFSGESKLLGFITKSNIFQGWENSKLWEWIEKYE